VRVTGLAPSPLFLLLAKVATGPARTAGIVLLVLGGWAVALCLHEFGHAVTAYRGGDRLVRAKGYLTLDIRRYTDPVMSLLLPLVLLALGGIPPPGGAVWINQSTGNLGWYTPLPLFVLIIGVPAVGNALFGASFAVFAALGGDQDQAIAGFREFLFWQ
jgi:hypothetical protein